MAKRSARATIPFPRVAAYTDKIVESLAAHDMRVHVEGDGYLALSPFGTARVTPGKAELHLSVEAEDGASLNRVRYALTGLIGFVAKTENPVIDWTGDIAGETLPPDLRILTVQDVRDLTPAMRRIVFTGDNLESYAVPDQIHCRLLFQPPGIERPEWPLLGDDGRIVWPQGGGKLDSRIYTIRAIDASAGRLEIDFFLHGNGGPGVNWARNAAPGNVVGLLGPAAHGPKPAGYHVLAGDETGLPGIARILEHLPSATRGIALIEVSGPQEQQDLAAPPGMEVRWLMRDGALPGTTVLLPDALRAVAWPERHDDVFVWAGCEYAAFRSITKYLRDEVGLARSRRITFSHWRRGMSEEDIVEVGGEAVAA